MQESYHLAKSLFPEASVTLGYLSLKLSGVLFDEEKLKTFGLMNSVLSLMTIRKSNDSRTTKVLNKLKKLPAKNLLRK